MKALYLLSLIVFCGIAGYVNSTVCKCGTSVSSSCCAHNSMCYKKSFFNPHHCDVNNRVDSSLCTKSTSFCKTNTSDMETLSVDTTTLSTNTSTSNDKCKCGKFEYSYSCCENSDGCHSSFFVNHCPV